MKKFKKIAIISFLCLFIVSIYSIANAEVREIEFKPNIDIPGFEEKVTFGDSTTENIAKYVKAIYDYGISIGAILATVVLMAAGVIWLTSGGSQDKIGQAKNMISGSIIGLVLLFGSYTILNLVNPELVDFNILDIDNIAELQTIYYCDKQLGGTEKVTINLEQRDNGTIYNTEKREVVGKLCNWDTETCQLNEDTNKWICKEAFGCCITRNSTNGNFINCHSPTGMNKKDCDDYIKTGTTASFIDNAKCKWNDQYTNAFCEKIED